MNDSWNLRVYEENQLVYQTELVGSAVLGRQRAETEQLYSRGRAEGRERVILAFKDDKAISREHALIEPQGEGGFRITNTSEKRRIGLAENQFLDPQSSCVVPGNALLMLGRKTVRKSHRITHHQPLRGLAEPTLPPGKHIASAASLSFLAQSPGKGGLDPKETLRWLRAAVDVLQSAASSADFFTKAAQALIDLADLDSGGVLLWSQNEWQTQALAVAPRNGSASGSSFSHSVLARVREEKRTFWQVPDSVAADAESVRNVEAIVAAPILDRHGQFLGVLYGERRASNGAVLAEPIGELEAMFVEVLAGGLAAGLARLEQEQAALAARVQFEQFFTPQLARQLARQPDLLEGRDTEVSLLFCDIRGFSRISERVGPAKTVEWINAVLGAALGLCTRSCGSAGRLHRRRDAGHVGRSGTATRSCPPGLPGRPGHAGLLAAVKRALADEPGGTDGPGHRHQHRSGTGG